jgi:hypothetical protein
MSEGDRSIVVHRDGDREIRITGLKRRKAVRISERHLIGGAWVERWSFELPLGLMVHTLDFNREDFVEAIQRDSGIYGFRLTKRDWGRTAAGAP